MCDIPGGVDQLWEDLGRPGRLEEFECPQCHGEGNGWTVEEWVDGSLHTETFNTRQQAEEFLASGGFED